MSNAKKLWGAALLLSLNFSAMAQVRNQADTGGASGGGGGAGVCTNSICQTVAQAGMVPSREATEVLSPAVAREIARIIDGLQVGPLMKIHLTQLVLNTPAEYVITREGQASATIRRIHEDYREALGVRQLPSNFVVYAYSDLSSRNPLFARCGNNREQTSVVPDFFRLDTRGRALVLIHEALYLCEKREDLSKVLRFDDELNKLLTGAQTDSIHLVRAFYDLKHDPAAAFNEALRSVARKVGGTSFSAEEIFGIEEGGPNTVFYPRSMLAGRLSPYATELEIIGNAARTIRNSARRVTIYTDDGTCNDVQSDWRFVPRTGGNIDLYQCVEGRAVWLAGLPQRRNY